MPPMLNVWCSVQCTLNIYAIVGHFESQKNRTIGLVKP